MENLSHLDIAKQLSETPASLEQLLKHVDDNFAQHKPDDAWCINEVIGHMIWSDEHAFKNRIKIMTEKLSDRLPSIDVNQAAKERQDSKKSLKELLEEFTEVRQDHVDYIRGLEPDTLNNSATFKDRIWLATDYLYFWPYHDYGHMKQIINLLRGNLVPYMSDTMREAVVS